MRYVGGAPAGGPPQPEIVDQVFAAVLVNPQSERVMQHVSALQVTDRHVVLAAARYMGVGIPKEYGHVHQPSVKELEDQLQWIPPTLPALVLSAAELAGQINHTGVTATKVTGGTLKVAGGIGMGLVGLPVKAIGSSLGWVADKRKHPKLGKTLRTAGNAIRTVSELPMMAGEGVGSLAETAEARLPLVRVAKEVVKDAFGEENTALERIRLAPFVSALALGRMVQLGNVPEEILRRYAKGFVEHCEDYIRQQRNLSPKAPVGDLLGFPNSELDAMYRPLKVKFNPDVGRIVGSFARRHDPRPQKPQGTDPHAEARRESLDKARIQFVDLTTVRGSAHSVFKVWDKECGLGPTITPEMLTAAYRALANQAPRQPSVQNLLQSMRRGSAPYDKWRKDIIESALTELQTGNPSVGALRVIMDPLSSDSSIERMSLGLSSRSSQPQWENLVNGLAVKRFGQSVAVFARDPVLSEALREAYLASLERQDFEATRGVRLSSEAQAARRNAEIAAANRFLRAIGHDKAIGALPLGRMRNTLIWAGKHGSPKFFQRLPQRIRVRLEE